MIDNDIVAKELRVVSDSGEQIGILSKQDALELAKKQRLSLVIISPNATPPVAKIMDYGKYVFESKKKQKKQKVSKLKEITMRPVTEEGDFKVKLRNLISFLEKGYKVKVAIRFRGREITHSELGKALLDRVIEETKDTGAPERMPKLEGRQMVIMMNPLRK